jgi:hypothetical protein
LGGCDRAFRGPSPSESASARERVGESSNPGEGAHCQMSAPTAQHSANSHAPSPASKTRHPLPAAKTLGEGLPLLRPPDNRASRLQTPNRITISARSRRSPQDRGDTYARRPTSRISTTAGQSACDRGKQRGIRKNSVRDAESACDPANQHAIPSSSVGSGKSTCESLKQRAIPQRSVRSGKSACDSESQHAIRRRSVRFRAAARDSATQREI